ncbi:MAG: oxidoreductase [Chloroflexi bacterium]|nr:MAG: oxidoreductase [Chloroflexota bacterium]
MTPEHCTVLIIGAGPAGLAAALELQRLGVGGILVVEREGEAGGTPRFCHHTGFGWHDLRRMYSGPDYARAYRKRVAAAGIEVRTSTMVTGWCAPHTVAVSGPAGVQQIEADAILLATGCRERPATARLVPGDRPAGVFTTGSLQRFVYEYGQQVGRRAVVVGAELVSLSAVLTLAHSHSAVTAMVTEHPRHQIYFPFTPVMWYAQRRLGVHLMPHTRVSRIDGHRRVEAIECTHVDTGQTETVPCDTVIFTGAWIPEHELARSGGLRLDDGTRGPQVDGALRTTTPGVFAAGNLLHGAQTADYAALEGRRAAQSVARFLAATTWPQQGVAVKAVAPVAWVTPNRVVPTELPGKSEFVFQSDRFCRNVYASFYQGDRCLFTQRVGQLVPNRSYYLPDHWLAAVDREAGCLEFRLAEDGW